MEIPVKLDTLTVLAFLTFCVDWGGGGGVSAGEYDIFWTAQRVVSMVKGGVTTLTFCSVQKQLCPVALLTRWAILRAEPLSILRIKRGSSCRVAYWMSNQTWKAFFQILQIGFSQHLI